VSERFTLAPVKGGWQIYDTVRREHIGSVRKTRSGAEHVLREIQKHRPEIARFILTGSTR
jgi:hypothetical protein